ncbi:MAG: uracil-DNA glycosylase [Chloroflexi bacterium]|nr:uracil-DNA glycosylase [Chloroflexota bacterium]
MTDNRVQELAQTRDQALGCQRCGLWRTRQHVVFGEGNPYATLLLIGEGPGATEDARGRPFVGQAGKLLDRALADAGLPRGDLWLTNLVRSRPCTLQNGGLRNRAPLAGEVAACRVWRDAEFDLVAPRVILCLGSVPASYLIHKDFRLNAERSQVFELEGTKCLATYHPSYPLRLAGEDYGRVFGALVADLKLAGALASE